MISLPFPPPVLGPNARPHWAQKARAFKRYKADCMIILSQHKKALAGRNVFEVSFHPPAAHRYDMDGLISRFKAGQDALAEVTGVNDYNFVMTYRRGEARQGGAVVIQ